MNWDSGRTVSERATIGAFDRRSTGVSTAFGMSFAILMVVSAVAFAHAGPDADAAGSAHASRVLGHIEFPTSTQSAEAQTAFIQGMLFLHLFEYDFAAAEFQRAQALDPGFAMAYWGEAMTYNHPIWDQQDRDKARAVLNRFAPTAALRRAKITWPEERDYLASLDILYGDGAKIQRDQAYRRFLSQMAARYPQDPEVQLFHALAIMGAHEGVRDIADYMESAAIAQAVFCANPMHPGAAHYLIHAVDDPIHAPLGLQAARALYAMAPDAGHSLHMTSHIFLALGMWDDVVKANTNAVRVANEMAKERGATPNHLGHYNFWLLYGLLQQGRNAEARALLDMAYTDVRAIGASAPDPMILDPDESAIGSMVQMWGRYLLETGGTDATVKSWQFNMGDAFDPNLTYLYILGMSSQDPAEIEAHLTAFRTLAGRLRDRIAALKEPPPTDLLYLARLEVIDLELQAVLARSRGDMAAAIEHASAASQREGTMPYSFGPPFVDYPSAQLLGELQMADGRYADAATSFTEQLKRSRNRTRVVQELAAADAKIPR